MYTAYAGETKVRIQSEKTARPVRRNGSPNRFAKPTGSREILKKIAKNDSSKSLVLGAAEINYLNRSEACFLFFGTPKPKASRGRPFTGDR